MAKKRVNVSGYARRTKSGKVVQVGGYGQNRTGGVAEAILKADPERPKVAGKAGSFGEGRSSIPSSPRVRAAETKTAKKTTARARAARKPKPTPTKRSQQVAVEDAAQKVEKAVRDSKAAAPASDKPEKAPDSPSQPKKDSTPKDGASSPDKPEKQRPTLRGIEPGRYTPSTFTPADRAARTATLKARLSKTLAEGDTQQRNTKMFKGPGGVKRAVYTPERLELHRQIIQDMVDDARDRGVPRAGQAIVSGGLPGAGKSFLLENHLGLDTNKYVTINPDVFKEQLAERTEVPGTEDGQFSAMEMAAVLHEESSDLAKSARSVFESMGYNVILDVTLGGAGEKAQAKHRGTVEGLRAKGYSVRGVFADIPHEMSAVSAEGRYWDGHADWMNGNGLGGRFVPGDVAANDVSTQGYNSSNRDNFESVKELFSQFDVYDTSDRTPGSSPTLLDSGSSRPTKPSDPFVTDAYDPLADPVAYLEKLLNMIPDA